MKSTSALTTASGEKRPSRTRAASIQSLSADILCAVFSLLNHLQLIRCSAVSKSWNKIILKSSLMRDLYYARHRNTNSEVPSEVSMRKFLADLAMEEHRLGFVGGSCEVYQWSAHSVRINLCCMKRGQVLTGAEDKVLRLWSAESYKCLDEYAVPNKNPLVDVDFDENKVLLVLKCAF